ncbi:hypothetical protein APHAL10511_004345 [Amanita phalloides]|nr:hypothetical protein APHAL10511_004345 [Amanita phalloides]
MSLILVCPRTPLTSRPLDLLYFCFFLIHVPVTLVGGVSGYCGWFKCFTVLEVVFQLLGMQGLYNDSRTIYVLLLIYGASTVTTTPTTTTSTIAQEMASVTFGQRILLLSSYIPFLLIPLIWWRSPDMASRIYDLIEVGMRVEEEIKLE